MLVNSNVTRGCGERQEGGLYACVGAASGGAGMPLEHFIVDPPVPWQQGPFRGSQLHERPDGIIDLVMWVGQEHYPYPSDFAEEGRRHGFSKRLSPKQDYSTLTPNQSRLVLVHPRVFYGKAADAWKPQSVECHDLHGWNHKSKSVKEAVDGEHRICVWPDIDRPEQSGFHRDCNHPPKTGGEITQCTFSLWDLSSQFNVIGHEVEDARPEGYEGDMEFARIVTPSCSYHVAKPKRVTSKPNWGAGIFLALPLTHFEFIGEDGKIPDNISESLGQNTLNTAVTPQ